MKQSDATKEKYARSRTVKQQMLAAIIAGMLIITLLLCLRFYLMLHFPGTARTIFLFEALSNNWDRFSYLIVVLKAPLQFALELLTPYLPANTSVWFPEMPAAHLLAVMTNHPAALYQTDYPGKVEWLTLLAIPFWNIMLLLLHTCFWYLKENTILQAMAQQSNAMLAEYKAQQQLSKAQKQQHTARQPASAAGGSSASEALSSAITRDRLSKSKHLSANMPMLHQPSQEEWEQYKQEQGNMIAQDMVRQLRHENLNLQAQQKQLKSTFSQYFSPQVLQYLEKNKGNFQNIENETHKISVMFCDIRGFSAYSQSASPDELVKYLGEYFEIASRIILQKHNGIVSKLMGDGLMAYWGFPVPNLNHAFIATSAAIEILKQVALRNHTRPDAPPLHVGIGIATGEAIVGNIGSSDFKDFTLLGPSVNMAARLEESNKTLGTSLLISATTYAGLEGRIPCHDCGEIAIRGWQTPEHVYSPIIKK